MNDEFDSEPGAEQQLFNCVTLECEGVDFIHHGQFVNQAEGRDTDESRNLG